MPLVPVARQTLESNGLSGELAAHQVARWLIERGAIEDLDGHKPLGPDVARPDDWAVAAVPKDAGRLADLVVFDESPRSGRWRQDRRRRRPIGLRDGHRKFESVGPDVDDTNNPEAV
jgi:hypothetical protein